MTAGRRSAARLGSGRPARFPGRVVATDLGLRFPEALSYAQWMRAGHSVARIASTSAWFVGDWLVCGQNRYQDRYREAVEAVGLDYQTVRNYAWVARRFPVERRRDGVSFQHHAEVASLDPPDQDRLLAEAEAHGWSRNVLRAQVQSVKRGGETAAAGPVVQPLKVDQDRVDRWMRAAAESGSSLESWMIGCLDQAATHVLSDVEVAAEPVVPVVPVVVTGQAPGNEEPFVVSPLPGG